MTTTDYVPALSDHALDGVRTRRIMAFVIDPAYQPPATAFKILNVVTANGDITLQWEARAGTKYQVQYATAVTGGWTDLGDEITATEATASYKDTAPADGARFYRILVK